MELQQFPRGRQSGAALILALIFLLLMTLLSTSSMRGATMQERMAGNMRDWNLGFQSAEAALREGESLLLTSSSLPEFNDDDGYYQLNSTARPVWDGATPSPGNGFLTYGGTIAGVARAPRYFIEKLSSIQPAGVSTETGAPVNEIYYFRITAVGYGSATEDDGSTPLTSVVLQSVYRSR